MEYLKIVLLQIYYPVHQWKEFENRLIFGGVIGKSLVSCFFWLTVYTYDHYGTLIGSHTLAVTSNKIVCHSDDWKCPKSSSVPAGFGLRYCNAAYCPHSGLARNRLSAEIRRSCRRTVTLIVCNLKQRYRSGKKAVCFKSSLPQVFVTRNNEYT